MSTASPFASGERANLILFLEGLQVPVISATITASEGSPAEAQIELIPADPIRKIRPRTLVHLFFWNDLAAQAGDEEGYSLAFAGEVASFSFSKSGVGGRSATIQCYDFSTYWDAAYLHQTRYANEPNAIAGNTQVFLSATDHTLLSDITSDSLEDLIAAFAAGEAGTPWSPTHATTQSAMGGLLAILELIGGVDNISAGLNGWFTYNERRIRLLDQLGSDNGDTAAALFDRTIFTRFLKNQLGRRGDVVSFRDILNTILGYVYYGVVPNPVACFRPGSREPLTVRPVETPPATSEDGDSFQPQVNVYLSANALLIGNGTEEGAFDAYLSSFNTATRTRKADSIKVIIQQFSAAGIPNDVIAAAIVNAEAESGLNPMVQSRADPPKGKPRTTDMDLGIDTNGASYKGHENSFGLFQLYALGAGKGMSIADRQDPVKNCQAILKDAGRAKVVSLYKSGSTSISLLSAKWAQLVERPGGVLVAMSVRANLAVRMLQGYAGATVIPAGSAASVPGNSVSVSTGAAATSERQRLISQVFRPDIWYAAPPICNVVFPEEYSNFSMQHNMQMEITRYQLSTADELISDPNDASNLLQTTYFAPVFADDAGKVSLTEGGIGSAAMPLIYDHERCSGIVPRIERMSDLSFMAAQASATEGAQVQVDYGQVVAAFNYLRYKYAARSASVSGRFMPRLLCGFPALVIDRPVTDNDSEAIHYLGMVRQVSHTISQSGANTSFSLAYVRPHRPDAFDEHVRKMRVMQLRQKASRTVQTASILDAAETRLADWLDAKLLLQDASALSGASVADAPPGPGGGKIIAVEAISRGVATSSTPASGATASSATQGGGYSFASATFIEEYGGANLPVEDAIRPAWVSTDYTNTNIGPNIYTPLFGCSSLTDVVTLEDAKLIDPLASAVSVEIAVDQIVRDYSVMSGNGSQVASGYIHRLTNRAFASPSAVLDDFHKQAYGNYDDLSGLNLDKALAPRAALAMGGRTLNEALVSAALDIRKERYEVIAAYLSKINGNYGMRG